MDINEYRIQDFKRVPLWGIYWAMPYAVRLISNADSETIFCERDRFVILGWRRNEEAEVVGKIGYKMFFQEDVFIAGGSDKAFITLQN